MKHSATTGLKSLGPISWSKLFRAWEKREARQTGWIRHYRERGFSSWREWRTNAYKVLNPQQRPWILYHVDRPELIVPTWYIGPFQGWKKHYRGQAVTFRTLAKWPTIQRHGKVASIVRRFPSTTQLLGVIWHGKIVVIEGTHRACAVAIAARRGKKLRTSMTIALTPLTGKVPDLSSGQKRR